MPAPYDGLDVSECCEVFPNVDVEKSSVVNLFDFPSSPSWPRL